MCPKNSRSPVAPAGGCLGALLGSQPRTRPGCSLGQRRIQLPPPALKESWKEGRETNMSSPEKRGKNATKQQESGGFYLVQVHFHPRYASGRGTVRSPEWREWLCFSPTGRGKPPVATTCFNPFLPPFHVLLCRGGNALGQLDHLLPQTVFPSGGSERPGPRLRSAEGSGCFGKVAVPVATRMLPFLDRFDCEPTALMLQMQLIVKAAFI